MAKLKTTETSESVTDFINKVPDERKRDDTYRLIELFQKQTGCEPKMWGPSIIGFGHYHYKYESGREGDMPVVAFSPRKPALVVYLSPEFEERDELLAKLGKHKIGKSCLHIKKLEDVNIDVLLKLTEACMKLVRKIYPDDKKK